MAKFTIKKVTTGKKVGEIQKLEAQRPTIDFPLQSEKITHPHYTIRVGAPAEARRVEIAINQGAWQVCRLAVGYWWFDWADIIPGEHEFIVRAQEKGGDWLVSETRQCFAVLP